MWEDKSGKGFSCLVFVAIDQISPNIKRKEKVRKVKESVDPQVLYGEQGSASTVPPQLCGSTAAGHHVDQTCVPPLPDRVHPAWPRPPPVSRLTALVGCWWCGVVVGRMLLQCWAAHCYLVCVCFLARRVIELVVAQWLMQMTWLDRLRKFWKGVLKIFETFMLIYFPLYV